MAIRGLVRTPTIKGAATPTNAPIYVDSDDNKVKIAASGNAMTEKTLLDSENAIASSALAPFIADATGAGGRKIASGLGTFVSGAVTIATGLASVRGFALTLNATGFATGATEVTSVAINPAPGATGAVAVQGYRLFTVTQSASGTGTFNWIAEGA